jgi:hypothetical protein
MIQYSELPATAQSFIQKYYNVSDISYVEREKDGLHNEYTVYLKNATKIEFNHAGNLESIESRNTPIPEGIVPSLIVNYVGLHHPDQFIVDYTIEYRHLKIELNNSLELIFDINGNFLRIDD